MRRFTLALSVVCVLLFGAWTIKSSLAQGKMNSISHGKMGMPHGKMAMMPMENRQAVDNTRNLIQIIKTKDMKNGTYNCCLKHSCIYCAAMMGACDCGKKLLAGKPVCNECKGGWDAGDGKFKGIKASEVKTMSRGMMRNMHNMKRMDGMNGMGKM